MSFSRSYFSQFDKDIKNQVKDYDARDESTKVEKKKCMHKSIQVVNGQLICSCGAGWSGPRIAELYEKLKGGK